MAEHFGGPRFGPAAGGKARQLVVLLHGVGADGQDLIELAPLWAEALPEAGVRAVAPAVEAFLESELARLALPPSALALMGFSQGAMTALFVGLRRAAPPAAILAYSGALLAPESLAAEIAGRPPVLLVHGEADEVVPVQASRAAESALRAAGVPVEARIIPGLGHGIEQTGLAAGAAALRRGFGLGPPPPPAA